MYISLRPIKAIVRTLNLLIPVDASVIEAMTGALDNVSGYRHAVARSVLCSIF